MAATLTPGKRFFIARVFPWAVVLIGVGSTWLGVATTLRARASASWPSVDGSVLSAAIDRESRRSGSGSSSTTSPIWRPLVSYEYAVDGTRHEGQRISYGEYATGEIAEAEAVVKRYPLGAAVRVHYDPDDPRQAVLEPGTAGIPWFFLAIGSVFSVIGVLLVVLMPRLVVRAP
jgi:hypothetical protein